MRRLLIIVVWIALAPWAPALNAQTAIADRGFTGSMSALEERLFADAADGQFDEFSPLGAALVAGGVQDDAELRHYEQKAAALVDELAKWSVSRGIRLSAPTTQRQQAETIFAFLHGRVFRGGYDLAATDLRQMLDRGRFNCVSATVLFNYLAGQCGLECRGLEMPSHAMTRVILPDSALDIEMTCPQWFQMPSDANRRPLPPEAREVTPVQLAAMIYYNRGVDYLSSKHFAEAAAANAKALRLDPESTTARSNLLATINNWSIELGNRRQYAEALDLLRQGIAMDANFQAFSQNYAHINRQWAESLSQHSRHVETKAVSIRPATSVPVLMPTRFGN